MKYNLTKKKYKGGNNWYNSFNSFFSNSRLDAIKKNIELKQKQQENAQNIQDYNTQLAIYKHNNNKEANLTKRETDFNEMNENRKKAENRKEADKERTEKEYQEIEERERELAEKVEAENREKERVEAETKRVEAEMITIQKNKFIKGNEDNLTKLLELDATNKKQIESFNLSDTDWYNLKILPITIFKQFVYLLIQTDSVKFKNQSDELVGDIEVFDNPEVILYWKTIDKEVYYEIITKINEIHQRKYIVSEPKRSFFRRIFFGGKRRTKRAKGRTKRRT